jgi:O-antigen/teichoic acid export membrane protein
LVRVTADRAATGDLPALRAVLRSVARWCTIGVLIVAVALRLPAAGGVSGLPFGRLSAVAYAGFMLSLLAATHAANQLAVSRGLGGLRDTVLIDGVMRPLLQLAATLAALIAGLSLSVVCAAWALPFVLSAVAAGIRTRAKIGAEGPATADRRDVRAFWTYTRPRSAGAVLTACLDRLDIVLAALLVTPAGAAVYTVASRLVAFALFPDQAVSQAYQPRMARAAAAGDHVGLQRLSRASAWESMILAGPIYLVLISFVDSIMRVYDGGHYAGARNALITLAIGGLLGSLPGPVDKTLILLGSTRASLVSGAASVATLIGLAIALTPRYGILGVAIGMSAATLVRNLISIAVLRVRWSLTPISAGLVLTTLVLAAGLVGVPSLIEWTGMSSSYGPQLIGIAVTVAAAAGVRRENGRRAAPVGPT